MSFLLFIFDGLLTCFRISIFSVVQRSHDLLPGAYVLHSLMISQFIFGLGLRLLFHIYCARDVEFCFSGLEKLWRWLLYLVLNDVEAIPI